MLSHKLFSTSCIFVNKALNDELPTNINNEYKTYHRTSKTRAAEAGKLNLAKHKTAKYQQCPLYRSIKTWNAVPATIDFTTTKQLKTQYQRMLLDTTYNGNQI